MDKRTAEERSEAARQAALIGAAKRRRDPEVDAMHTIASALDALDRSATHRIISWAQDRYVRSAFIDLDPDYFHKFSEALANAARQMGDITPLDIIRLVEECHRLREAAVGSDESFEVVTPAESGT